MSEKTQEKQTKTAAKAELKADKKAEVKEEKVAETKPEVKPEIKAEYKPVRTEQNRPYRPQRHVMQKTGNASAPYAPQPANRQPNGAKPMDARELNKLSIAELTKLAVNYNIEDISGLRKAALIGKIIAIQAKQNGSVYGIRKVRRRRLRRLRGGKYAAKLCRARLRLSDRQRR